MVDYDFYVNHYLGALIPEKAFAGSAKQAEAALERICRIYRVADSGEESRRMALCAMAETVYTASRRRSGVSSASVGSVSVRYDNTEGSEKALWRELYQRAAIYLDIYRGAAI
ncbi:MAG: hypothetical protein IJO04_04715 [Oscillospiraceae bacterium]|nr:hypothetical protein [Oscillospiraceae bacterium]